MDTFSPQERSDIMRRVRSRDTAPEKQVRSLLHRLGFRFRLHRADLAGNPDIVLTKHRTIVFVHGCFWHRHPGCPRASTPATRREYWLPKFRRTRERDHRNGKELRRNGWKVIIVWECELRDPDKLAKRLWRAISGEPIPYVMEHKPMAKAAETPAAYQRKKRTKRSTKP